MLHPPLSASAEAQVTPPSPRNTVLRYPLGAGRAMLVSYDADGAIFERFETCADLATPALAAKMQDRLRGREIQQALAAQIHLMR